MRVWEWVSWVLVLGSLVLQGLAVMEQGRWVQSVPLGLAVRVWGQVWG